MEEKWKSGCFLVMWHQFLTSKLFYIQDGIWKWHCFDAETWQEVKKELHYRTNK